MLTPDSAPTAIERHIALGRVLLSVAALFSVWVDPTTPSLSRWLRVTGGLFMIDGPALIVLGIHFAYAIACLTIDLARPEWRERFAHVTVAADVVFGVAVAVVTEGVTSPAYVFFAFAILAAGARSGARVIGVVTGASVLLYLGTIVTLAASDAEFLMMRPVYLAVTGGLVAYLAQRRLDCERRAHEAEHRAERQGIARTLHDGYVQALAALNIRLENCRTLLGRDQRDDVIAEIAALQLGVRREYDEVRSYVRSLAALDDRTADTGCGQEPHCTVSADLAGSGLVVEHVLQIMLEGVRNVRRHAHATGVHLAAERSEGAIRITISDDGVGFREGDAIPWTIASRAQACGGIVRLADRDARGGELIVDLPRT